MKEFSTKEILNSAWAKFRENPGFFIGVVIFVFFVNIFFSFLMRYTSKMTVSNVLGAILSIYFQTGLSLGMVKITLDAVDGKELKFSQIFSCFDRVFKSILASILAFFAILGGFVLLIVPGIMLGVKFMFLSYPIVDEDSSALEALKGSSIATKGMRWKLLWFAIVMGLVNLAGLLAFGVGLLVSIPVTGLATSLAWRFLKENAVVLRRTDAEGNSACY